MNFEPDLRYRFYCVSVLIKFTAIVFELGIFSAIYSLRISSQLHIQKFWHKFPSNYKPSQFWNANFPPIISPSECKPLPKISPSKRSFEKYKPRGLFSEFYGNSRKSKMAYSWFARTCSNIVALDRKEFAKVFPYHSSHKVALPTSHKDRKFSISCVLFSITGDSRKRRLLTQNDWNQVIKSCVRLFPMFTLIGYQ